MKKIIILFFLCLLLLCFSSIFPKKSYANCVSPDPGLICIKPKYPVKCVVGIQGEISCCGTQQECDDIITADSQQHALDLDQIQASAFPGNTIPTDIGVLIGNTLPYIFGAAGLALLVFLVLGGFQMMTSRGDPKAIQSAQAKITNAVIGFIIVIFAYIIVLVLGRVLGIQNTLFGQIFNK